MADAPANALSRGLRYGQAAIGPVASAGAQFALSLALLRHLPHDQFGSFAFLLVASQFSWGLWSALFCAPLPLLLATAATAADREAIERALFVTNLIGAIFAAGAFLAIGISLRLPSGADVIFAIYAAVALVRWFARAHGYATGQPLRTMSSDLVYATCLVVGALSIVGTGSASLVVAYGALLAGAVLGMLPFGARYLSRQFVRLHPTALRRYGAIWREHSAWSLTGVITTEATANSHAYMVTALYGPSAFAPLAASALLIRPIGVAMNALSEFERAQMARQIAEDRIREVTSSVHFFRLVLVVAWLFTAIAMGALLMFAPRLLFPATYDLQFLIVAALLWLGVAGMRLIRAPESTLLQAAGQFRPLAIASIWSSIASVAGVLLLLWLGGPLWSIVGIALGEALFAGVTYFQAHRWRQARDAASPILVSPAIAP